MSVVHDATSTQSKKKWEIFWDHKKAKLVRTIHLSESLVATSLQRTDVNSESVCVTGSGCSDVAAQTSVSVGFLSTFSKLYDSSASFCMYRAKNKIHSFCIRGPVRLSSLPLPFPSPSPSEVGPLKPTRSVSSPSGVGDEPKSNLVHSKAARKPMVERFEYSEYHVSQ